MAKKREYRKRGTGTVQRQPDGTFIARTSDKSRSGRFPDRSSAEAALEVWNRALIRGSDPNEARQKLRDFIRSWLVEVVRPNVAPGTYEHYKRHAGYATAIIGDLAVEAIGEQAIERMLNRLATEGLRPQSVEHVRAVLHNALNVARRWGLRPDNPVTLVPHRRIPARPDRALTPAQLATFAHGIVGDRLEALYHLMFTLGLRRGEALGLRVVDVDLAAGTVHVVQQVKELEDRRVGLGELKSDEGLRLLPLPTDCAAHLAARLDALAAEARTVQQRAAERAAQAGEPTPIVRWNPHGLLFPSEVGTWLQPSNFNRAFVRLVARINEKVQERAATEAWPADTLRACLLPDDLSPHDLRKTALTDLAAHGEAKAVQSIAGHADIDTTMRVYAGRRMAAMRAAVDAVERERRRA